MRRKVFGLIPHLLIQRLRHGRSLDVLVTPSPPLGIQDGPDPAHRGFQVFCWFMKTLRLQYLIHGHKHVYDPREVTECRYCDMWVVNAYGHKVLDIESVTACRDKPAIARSRS